MRGRGRACRRPFAALMFARVLFFMACCLLYIHTSPNISEYSISMHFLRTCALLVPAFSAILFNLSPYPRGNLACIVSVFSAIYRSFARFFAFVYVVVLLSIFQSFLHTCMYFCFTDNTLYRHFSGSMRANCMPACNKFAVALACLHVVEYSHNETRPGPMGARTR